MSSASDNEYQHALEVIPILHADFSSPMLIVNQVVFDPQNAHRRKSSLVAADTGSSARSTECYVHALLEEQRKHGRSSAGNLEGITETLAEHRIANGGDCPNDDSTVEPKQGGDDDSVPGQEDEQAWRKRIEAKDLESPNSGAKMELQEPHAVHSRLLTKRQLSDMAWGVRELSKRLGSIRLKLKVKTVFLLTKAYDETLIGNTREVARWLLSPDRQVRYTVWVENTLKENNKFDAKGLLADLEKDYAQKGGVQNGDKPLERRLRYWNNDMCRTRPHTFDFVVTLGGDGTVLYASWLFQRIVPPVLSFALGSLGFLTKFDYEEFEDTLTKSFRDGVTISLRLRFEGTVMRSQRRKGSALKDGETAKDDDEIDHQRDLVEELVGEEKEDDRTHRPDGTYEILNDIVVDRGPNPSKYSQFRTPAAAYILKPCPRSKFSATTSISLLSKQMESVLPPPPDQQPTI